jgi:hypothetical protein
VKSNCPRSWFLNRLKPSIVSFIIEIIDLNCEFLAVNGTEKWYTTPELMLNFIRLRIFIRIKRVKVIWTKLEPTEKRNN